MEFNAELHKSGQRARKINFHAKSIEQAQEKAITRTHFQPDYPHYWAQLPDDIVEENDLGIAMYWTANSLNHMLSVYRTR